MDWEWENDTVGHVVDWRRRVVEQQNSSSSTTLESGCAMRSNG